MCIAPFIDYIYIKVFTPSRCSKAGTLLHEKEDIEEEAYYHTQLKKTNILTIFNYVAILSHAGIGVLCETDFLALTKYSRLRNKARPIVEKLYGKTKTATLL